MTGIGVGVGLAFAAAALAPAPYSFLGSDLYAAWDAERRDQFSLSGSQVNNWADAIASQPVAQAFGVSKPLYLPAGFYGRPGVFFDGIDDYLEMLGVGNLPIGAEPCEIWALVDQQSDGAVHTSARNVISWGSSTSTSRRLRRTVSNNTSLAQAVLGFGEGLGQGIPSNLSVPFDGPKLVRVRVEAGGPTRANVSINTNLGIFANLTSLATGNMNLRIGSQEGSGPGGYWQGVMNLLLVTKLLDTAASSRLTTDLMARGGLV